MIMMFVLAAGIAEEGFGSAKIQLVGAKTRTIDKDCPGPVHQNNCDWGTNELEFTIIYNVAAAGKKVTKGTVTVDNGIALDVSTAMGLPKANGTYVVSTTWNMVCEDPN